MKLKRIVMIMLIFMTLFALSLPVSASNTAAEAVASEESPMPLTEETRWYFRVHNGVWEQRLWSHTFGRWLTNWHPVNS